MAPSAMRRAPRFERTAEQIAGVLAEVRRISHGLRPALLDDLGLAAALDHLAAEFSEHSGMPVAFSSVGEARSLAGAAGRPCCSASPRKR